MLPCDRQGQEVQRPNARALPFSKKNGRRQLRSSESVAAAQPLALHRCMPVLSVKNVGAGYEIEQGQGSLQALCGGLAEVL